MTTKPMRHVLKGNKRGPMQYDGRWLTTASQQRIYQVQQQSLLCNVASLQSALSVTHTLNLVLALGDMPSTC